jgi:hypothetical protein
MMKRVLAAGLLVLLLLSCTASRVNPKADVALAGSVQRAGGVPVANVRLALMREGDAGEAIFTLATLGVACLLGSQGPAICQDARYTTTASNGAFAYALKGKDTQSTFGFSAVLSLTTALAPAADEVAGPSTTYRFHVQTTRLDLPIRLWEPTPSARTGSFGARVSFPKVLPGLMPAQIDGSVGYSIEFARGDEIVWELTGASPVTLFDPRLLEDSLGTMRVIASASSLHVSEQLGDEVAFALRSGARAYESPLNPPPSRGKPCFVADEEGKRNVVSPCRVTDGDFSKPFTPSVCSGQEGCTEPRHESAVVDLGSAAPVDLIVVRGCLNSCRVETSTDLRLWRLVGSMDAERAAFPIASARRARYVRVSSPFVDNLTEISAWSGRPVVPSGSLLISPATFRTKNGGGSSLNTTKRARTTGFAWLALAAAALIGAVGGAAAMAIARRRRAT